MRLFTSRRLPALLLALVLALGLAACDSGGTDAEANPREALREAVTAMTEYEGTEFEISAQLDEAAQSDAREEGDFSDEELELLTGSTLVVRSTQGSGDEQGESEVEVTVADEQVFSLRALPDYELYALVDLPAVERVAESMDAGDDFREAISGFEQMAGMAGLGEVLAAAQDGDWIQIAGVEQMAGMAEDAAGDQGEEPDEEEVEELTREIGQRLLAFLEDEDVQVAHVGDDDAGQRLRVTASGAKLQSLMDDLTSTVEDASGFSDPTGMGLGAEGMDTDLTEEIPEDAELSIDAWVDGGRLSQVGVDVLEVARTTGEDADVPDEGEFLVLVGIDEFTDAIEAPDAATTFDLFDAFGALMGGMGDMGGMGELEGELDGMDEAPDEPTGEAGDAPEEAPTCLEREEIDPMLEGVPDADPSMSDDEVEELLGIPVC